MLNQDDKARNTEFIFIYLYIYISISISISISILVSIPVSIYQYLYVYLYLRIRSHFRLCLDNNIFVLKCIISGGGAEWRWHAGLLVQPRQAPLSGCRRAHGAALRLVGHRSDHCASGESMPLRLPQVQANLGNTKIYYFYMQILE